MLLPPVPLPASLPLEPGAVNDVAKALRTSTVVRQVDEKLAWRDEGLAWRLYEAIAFRALRVEARRCCVHADARDFCVTEEPIVFPQERAATYMKVGQMRN